MKWLCRLFFPMVRPGQEPAGPIDEPLSRKLMCVECDAIVPAGQRRCPSCLCTTFIPVGRLGVEESSSQTYVWRAA